MPLDNTLRTGIKASIVSGLLMLFVLGPLIRGVWNVLLRLGPGVFQHIVNDAYGNASLGNRNWVVALIAIFGLGGLSSIILGIMIAILIPDSLRQRWRERRKQISPDKLRRRRRWTRGIFMLMAVLFILSCLQMAAPIFIDLQLNAGFEQRLAVLAPSVPDATVKNIRAEWARMNSRSDYLQINAHMEELARQNKVDLPRPLLP